MNLIKFYFLVLTLLLTSKGVCLNNKYLNYFPSLVNITSIYLDQGSSSLKQKYASINGYGILIMYNHRFFVLTASHVSQGRDLNLQLLHNNESIPLKILSPINRVWDNNHDLEIIEVDNSNLPNVEYFNFTCYICNGELDVDPMKRNLRGYISITTDKLKSEITPIHFINNRYAFPVPFNLKENLVKHLKLNKLPDNYNIDNYKIGLLDVGKWWYNLDLKILPGMSGLPLLEIDSLSSQFLVKGITRTTLRAFNKSFFANPLYINDLLIRAINNTPMDFHTPLSSYNSLWLYHSLFGPFRQYTENLFELFSDSIQAGGPDSTDGAGSNLHEDNLNKVNTSNSLYADSSLTKKNLGLYHKQRRESVLAFKLMVKKSNGTTLEDIQKDEDSPHIEQDKLALPFTNFNGLAPLIYADHFGHSLVNDLIDLYRTNRNKIFDPIYIFSSQIRLSDSFRLKLDQGRNLVSNSLEKELCHYDYDSFYKSNLLRIRINKVKDNKTFIVLEKKFDLIDKQILSNEFNQIIDIGNDNIIHSGKSINIMGLFMLDASTLTKSFFKINTISASSSDNYTNLSTLENAARYPYIFYSPEENTPERMVFCYPAYSKFFNDQNKHNSRVISLQ